MASLATNSTHECACIRGPSLTDIVAFCQCSEKRARALVRLADWEADYMERRADGEAGEVVHSASQRTSEVAVPVVACAGIKLKWWLAATGASLLMWWAIIETIFAAIEVVS